MPPATSPASLHARRRLTRGGTKLGHTGWAAAISNSERGRGTGDNKPAPRRRLLVPFHHGCSAVVRQGG